jgi:hypothetical protein
VGPALILETSILIDLEREHYHGVPAVEPSSSLWQYFDVQLTYGS